MDFDRKDLNDQIEQEKVVINEAEEVNGKKSSTVLKNTMLFSVAVLLIIGAFYAGTIAFKREQEAENNQGVSVGDDKDAVMVTVNGTDITYGEYENKLAEFMAIYESRFGADIWDDKVDEQYTYREYIEEKVLDTMILEIVMLGEAKKENIQVSDDEVKEKYEEYKSYFTSDEEYNSFLESSGMTDAVLKEAIEKELITEKFLEVKSAHINEVQPTEDELKEIYNQSPSTYNRIRASHILVDTEEEAKEIQEKIKNGENFEELAKEFSTCGSAENGGDLGYFLYSDMVEEFSKVAFNLKVNEISDIIRTVHGYHIIKVTDIKNTYEQAQRDELVYKFQATKFNEMLDELINNANIVRK